MQTQDHIGYLLHPSEKAVRRFRLKPISPADPDQERLIPWYMHWRLDVIGIDRQFFILLVNVSTLFSGLLRAGGMRDLESRLHSKLNSLIVQMGLPSQNPGTTYSIRYSKTGNRSLFGSINDMLRMLKFGINPVPVSSDEWLALSEDFLNTTPFRLIDMNDPRMAVKLRLDNKSL